LGDYAAHLFFIHPLFESTFDSISGPLWTLGVEVQFYLIFPLIASVVGANPISAYLAVIVVAETYRLALIATGHDSVFFTVNQLPAFLDVFVGGMVAAYAVVWARANVPDLDRYRLALTAGAAGAVAAAVWGLVELAQSPAMQSTAAFFEWQSRYRPAIAAILIVLAVCSVLAAGHWRRALANPIFLFLSAISYNLYAHHLCARAADSQWNMASRQAASAPAIAPAVTSKPLLIERAYRFGGRMHQGTAWL